MSVQCNVCDFAPAVRIDHGDGALPIAYEYPVRLLIHANVVGIGPERYVSRRRKVRSVKEPHWPSAALDTNTVSVERMYAMPCGVCRPDSVRTILRALRSTMPTLSLPSSAT